MSASLIVVLIYLGIVLSIGPITASMARRGSRDDFFLAQRSIGPFLMLMSLFGTHMSAFSLVGSTGKSYVSGIGVYGLMAASTAFSAPLVIFFIAPRIWRVGKDHGFVTQCQYFRARWESDLVGLLMFVLLIAMLIPYLLMGVVGGGVVFNALTTSAPGAGDGVPRWLGSLLIVSVTTGYVFMGGLRGTAWANALQTIVFMVVGGIAFVVITRHIGGSGSFLESLQAAMASVAEKAPSRLVMQGNFAPSEFFSYTFITFASVMMPHLNMHWMTAKRAGTFRPAIILYPLCLMVVWLPATLIGTMAAAELSLPAAKANAVLVVLIKQSAGPVLAGVLAAGVLAAVMSSLDSQTLALSEMFTTDVINHYLGQDRLSERVQIWLARGFVVAILAVTWVISLFDIGLVFTIGTWCFAGLSSLAPITLAALFWKRSTACGAIASALAVAGLGAYFLYANYMPGKGFGPGTSTFGIPVHPVIAMLLASSLAMVVVSLLTPPPSDETLTKFHPPN
ncbi:Sodium/proline symporter [Planctomycetes bacterium Pan216]|uniref:Sodium/proline symporter n=1 Tax=Kolteria novifilia TaxID=2527975 RepID=A0A518B310_9BACT|nr:Sodium/proline symporter [Planctomycetes bacterium Pan216]